MKKKRKNGVEGGRRTVEAGREEGTRFGSATESILYMYRDVPDSLISVNRSPLGKSLWVPLEGTSTTLYRTEEAPPEQ